MIKSFIKKKTKRNKRGSMLTLVLVILAMSLILISSSIMITSATRSRYYDNTLSSQARLAATSVAESICSAITNQNFTDADLEACADNGVSSVVSGIGLPGIGGAGDNQTEVKFSRGTVGGVNYIYIDVSTTLGTKGNSGAPIKENVRVFLKHKDPEDKATLFNHLIEVGQEARFSEFHVGDGAPAGTLNNTVFAHGNTHFTKNGTGSIKSDIIATDRVKLGNGSVSSGYLLFAGKNAGFVGQDNNGSVTLNDIYFMNPDASAGQGTSTDSPYNNIDLHVNTATFLNFNITGKLGQNYEVKRWYNAGNSNAVVSDAGYNNRITSEAEGDAKGFASTDDVATLSAKANQMLAKAVEALKPENAFPSEAAASAKFYANVPQEIQDMSPQALPVAGGTLAPGKYTLPSSVSQHYICDASSGGYIFLISGSTQIASGCFEITGGSNDSDANWPRFIISSGASLTVGGYAVNASDMVGIISTAHNPDGSAVHGTKPHCYIYGYNNSHFAVKNERHKVDAYIGLFGDGSDIEIMSYNFVYGRLCCTNFSCDNANGTHLDYCPAPDDDVNNDNPEPAVTEYDIVRFQYYYTA